jgi:hypothetical protein
MELYIKNMVCARCIKVVQEELLKLDLHPIKIDLGIVNQFFSPGRKHLPQSPH